LDFVGLTPRDVNRNYFKQSQILYLRVTKIWKAMGKHLISRVVSSRHGSRPIQTMRIWMPRTRELLRIKQTRGPMNSRDLRTIELSKPQHHWTQNTTELMNSTYHRTNELKRPQDQSTQKTTGPINSTDHRTNQLNGSHD